MMEEETARNLAMQIARLAETMEDLVNNPHRLYHLVWQCGSCLNWNGTNLEKCRGCGSRSQVLKL